MKYRYVTRDGAYDFEHKCDLDARKHAAELPRCHTVIELKRERVVWRKPLTEAEFKMAMESKRK